ncbi:Protein CBG24667 [Caenorhabditis briggsae]|uniref:Protein CBG24667 n=1 Tax=Caenorhabditis briggsae TaxID=6238 RepID=A8WL74_CAEBR|nr:Protein CBG24667 [Caenorhabditis briggsae]CAP21219.1 Protein CBG24667 [Caenorhabditis briggsae]
MSRDNEWIPEDLVNLIVLIFHIHITVYLYSVIMSYFYWTNQISLTIQVVNIFSTQLVLPFIPIIVSLSYIASKENLRAIGWTFMSSVWAATIG